MSGGKKEVSEVVKLAREHIRILDYFNNEVVGVKKGVGKLSGLNYAMICPLHDETDASFHLYKSGGVEWFHCFGCGASGDVVDLFKRIEWDYHSRGYKTKELCAEALLKKYGFGGLLKDIKPVSPLDLAMQKVKSFSEKNSNGSFSFIRYRDINNSICSSAQSNKQKAKSYGELDAMLASFMVVLEQGNENN